MKQLDHLFLIDARDSRACHGVHGRYAQLLAGEPPEEDFASYGQASPSPVSDRIAVLENEVAGLRSEVGELRRQLEEFQRQFT